MFCFPVDYLLAVAILTGTELDPPEHNDYTAMVLRRAAVDLDILTESTANEYYFKDSFQQPVQITSLRDVYNRCKDYPKSNEADRFMQDSIACMRCISENQKFKEYWEKLLV